jgi:Domain of unknown function (DUF1905)
MSTKEKKAFAPNEPFQVRILQAKGSSFTYVEFPFDVPELFGTHGRVPVRGTIGGFPFKSSLAAIGGPRHVMAVDAKLREGAKCAVGQLVTVTLEKDIVVESPPDKVASPPGKVESPPDKKA